MSRKLSILPDISESSSPEPPNELGSVAFIENVSTADPNSRTSSVTLEAVIQPLVETLPENKVDEIVAKQTQCKQTLQNARQELIQFQQRSQLQFQELTGRIQQHTGTIREIKSDLDIIFQRIRTIKRRIAVRYPEVYNYVQTLHPPISHEDDSDEEEAALPTSCRNAPSEPLYFNRPR